MGSRFYVPAKNIDASEIHVSGKEAHHIIDVMRLIPGDEVTVFDGEGKEYEGVIKQGTRQSVSINIRSIGRLAGKKHAGITLAQAIPRKGKMDYLVQKCTELGIERIIPLVTARTVVRLSGTRLVSRHQRWQRIAAQASKQCGRIKITEIEQVSDFAGITGAIKFYDLALMPCIDKQSKELKKALRNYKSTVRKKQLKIIIFIGPEGGFTLGEIKTARNNGAVAVSLGENTLKSDTAAISSIAIVDYELRL